MTVGTDVEVPIRELRRRCLATLMERGASPHEATVVFDDYLDAEVRGRASHGFASFGTALSAFPRRGDAEICLHASGVVAMRGNGDCGHTALRAALDAVIPHIAEQRSYVVGVSDVTRVNCPGVIARYGADRGVISLVLEYGGKNLMAPEGSGEPVLSTNPLAVAFPGTSPMFLLDFATSERALGYVTLAKLRGEDIPASWAADSDGNPTSDPDHVAAMRPFGGHKGFGLALAIELLAGVLTGTPVGSRGELDSRGVFMLLLSPSVFGVREEEFSKRAQSFLNEVVSPASQPGAGVSYPGQASAERWSRARTNESVVMPAVVWEQLSTQLGGME